ncbi:MAG TPA: 3-isopropylmalate dehydrogenase [Pyrinomonadaceae bacterium]|jgi:3-isopropylmalate dehydrogenase|nr:3-isopropylmalate dehydrogenase [Pyrinomonadaceae bacterium]
MNITILPGDGVGPEVTKQAVQVLNDVCDVFRIPLETDEHLVGGAAINATGSPFPDKTRDACVSSDAVLLGAVGSPEFDDRDPAERPEIGLLQLRKALGGFANLRPAKAYPELIDSSPLRKEVFAGTDMVIVRELLGGIYFGEPRGIEADSAFNTMRYSVAEVERVARVAFEIARGRKKKVTSVDKANVLETSRLWRETVTRVGKEFPDIELEHGFVDSCAMHLVTSPTRFDVILTENMFGDILSDEAAVLTGSLGMLASATIGGDVDLFEPIHGSAPDIAGNNIANPLGAIASVAMLLRHTAKNDAAADAIEKGIQSALEAGYRTRDIVGTDSRIVSTEEMGAVVSRLAVENATFSRANAV